MQSFMYVVISEHRITLNLPHTWRLPPRRLLRHRVTAPKTEGPYALDQVASNCIHSALGRHQRRTQRSCLLHLEETNAGAIPYTDGAGRGAGG